MNGARRRSLTILMAEDDEDDRMMAREAMAEAQLTNELRFVDDGEELMEYLQRRGRYAGRSPETDPGLLLLDLNMPRKDGREVLRELKNDPVLRTLPVVVLTTSKADEDVLRSYQLGVNSFVTKPVSFADLVEVMRMLGKYWFEIVELPG